VTRRRDPNLDVLLDLDGQVLVVDPEGGHWVRFVVTRIPVSAEKPHGIDLFADAARTRWRVSGRRYAHLRFLERRGPGIARERGDIVTTLKVGIASYEEMKARTMEVARGQRRIAADEPKVWFTSTESFAKVLSAGNRELLRIIRDKAPGSLDELSRITGKAKSNLSRTLRTMEGYGLVRLERGERGRITPKVLHDRVELELPLASGGG
jgi:predicted transcriptional regulator